jgi:hypothetical protein
LTDPQPPFDYQKWLHEQKFFHAQRAHDKIDDFFLRTNEAAIKAGEVAIRMAMLMNGGAAVAVLAFIGGLISKDKIAVGKLGTVADSLTWFAAGVACSMAAMALAYFTNYCIAGAANSHIRKWDEPFIELGLKTAFWRRLGLFFQIAAVSGGIASLVCFVAGMLSVKTAITHLL